MRRSLHSVPYGEPDFDLRQARGHFLAQQWDTFHPRKCGFDPELVRATLHGVQVALRECERQMLTERWNCSRLQEAVGGATGTNIFGRLLWKGIPETAFALAMISAGVTASVASECRRALRCCPCRMSLADAGVPGVPGGAAAIAPAAASSITHADCDHNAKYASAFTRKLMEKVERGRDVRHLAMLHNYNAGRRAVMKTMGTKCLCHGTSGSCTHRICWREVANFQTIASYLKQRYHSPVLVKQSTPVRLFLPDGAPAAAHSDGNIGDHVEGGGGGRRRRRQRLQPRQRQQRRLNLVMADAPGGKALPRKHDLVYYETAPESFFCKRDDFWGVIGLADRICSAGQGNCSRICCTGTFRIEYYKHVDTKCNCRFVWCCEVKCQTCVTDRMRKVCD